MKTTTITGASIDVIPQPSGNILKITEIPTGETTLVPMDGPLSKLIGSKLTAPRVELPSNGNPTQN